MKNNYCVCGSVSDRELLYLDALGHFSLVTVQMPVGTVAVHMGYNRYQGRRLG